VYRIPVSDAGRKSESHSVQQDESQTVSTEYVQYREEMYVFTHCNMSRIRADDSKF
jgi:hypothetical protein